MKKSRTILYCKNCLKQILRVRDCTDLTIICPVCGYEIYLNIKHEATILKTRPPHEVAHT